MKHRIPTYIFSITITYLMPLCMYAYYPTVRNFTKDSYRSGAQNWCIAQGEGGNIWSANSEIIEFNGKEWTGYKTLNRTSARSLYYDKRCKRMYFGATNEFGYMHINENDLMEYVSLTDSIKINTGEIWAIHKQGDTFWLRENNNIYSFDSKEVKQYRFNDKIAFSSIIDNSLTIFVNNIGAMRMGPGNEFMKIEGTDILDEMHVCAIIPYTDQSLLFVTATEGLFLLKNGILSAFDTELSNQLKKDNVYCAESNGKYISYGTVSNGVYIKDISTDNIMHLNTDSGLQNNTVLSMFYDSDGNLWLGLDKGIDMISLSSAEYRLFGDPDQYGAGYASAIFEGRLWLGTNQGLYHTDIAGEEEIKRINEIKGQVWALQVFGDHLFCCNDKGIHIIKGKRISHIPMNGAWKLESLKDHPDILLGCSYEKLFLLKKRNATWMFDGWIDGFNESSKVFEEDSDGKIWFSHWLKGLFRLEIDFNSRTVTKQEYLAKNVGFPEDWGNTPMDINGEIIFHTPKGFYLYDAYDRNAYSYDKLNDLFETPPAGANIYITPENDLYISSGKQQIFCDRTEDGFRVDSLSLSQLTSRRIVGFDDIISISDDKILVNTEDGFSIIRTDILKEKEHKSGNSLYISEISLSQKNDTIIYTSRSKTNFNSESIELPYRDNSLKFKAVLPSFSSGSTVLYSFMLEHFDKDWSQFSETNSKEYTKLPHGKYHFKVRAKAHDSSDIQETGITIFINAPWYLTTWAIIVYLLIVILIGYMIRKGMHAFMLKRKMQMRKENEEEMMKRKMKMELDHKAQDLAASTMNVIRKNEILLDIDSELESLSENMTDDRNKMLKRLAKIRHMIKENIQHDNIWQQFEENFDIVYDDFLKRLGEQYPQLTVSDKKMCAYLKMDLSSKEIAPLLNLTVRSVEMTRYRLRKKLGLSRENNLTEFLQNF